MRVALAAPTSPATCEPAASRQCPAPEFARAGRAGATGSVRLERSPRGGRLELSDETLTPFRAPGPHIDARGRIVANVRLCVALLVVACSDPAIDKPRTSAGHEAGGDEFPSLKIFESSAWWKMVQFPTSDANSLRNEIRECEALLESDELDPEPHRESAWKLVPSLFAALRPLCDKDEWSRHDVECANVIASHLARSVASPSVSFTEESTADNRERLRTLVRWFRERTSEPRTLGCMILTMDDGPFYGVDAGESVLFSKRDAVVAGQFQVTLGECPRGDTTVWALRGSRGGRVLWTRILSRDGRPIREAVMLQHDMVEEFGPYGWRVHLGVAGEHGHVYIGRDGHLLFYFLSW